MANQYTLRKRRGIGKAGRLVVIETEYDESNSPGSKAVRTHVRQSTQGQHCRLPIFLAVPQFAWDKRLIARSLESNHGQRIL
jgi:hypothetical protein